MSICSNKISYKDVIKGIELGLYPYTNDNKISGFIVFIFHLLVCGIPGVYLMIGDINYIYFLCIGLWLFVFWLHFYFKGCILVKTERYLWDTRDWYGPWSMIIFPLQNVGVEITKSLTENIFLGYGLFLTLYVFINLYSYYTKNM